MRQKKKNQLFLINYFYIYIVYIRVNKIVNVKILKVDELHPLRVHTVDTNQTTIIL